MQWEEKRLNCEQHPDSELSVIDIGQNSTTKSRFLCIECVLGGGEQFKKQGFSQLIKIKDFFTNPGMQYRNTIFEHINAYIQEIDKQIEQLINFIKKFQESIQTNFEQLKYNVNQLRMVSTAINEEIEKQSNFDELRFLFQTIKRMDSFQGTQIFKKIQENINALIKNFPQFYTNAIKSTKIRQEMAIKDYKKSLRNISNDLSSILSACNKYETNMFNQENQIDISFVIQNIGNGDLLYDLLYQGTRDGLTSANYWQKCDQQSHLLTIITLKNGNIFGGYSPCLLNKELSNYYVVDNTNSSFIFQYNKKEIYKLKDKVQAIYCRQDLGPAYGWGQDFQVSNDFKTLSSNLGHSYDIKGYNVQNNRTHLIGEKDSEIIECKVYKITFL